MPTKEDIDNWLKAIGKNRKWLAEKCLVQPGQCYNWFAVNGKIPKKKLLLIKSWMEEQTQEVVCIDLPDLDSRGKMELRLDYETQLKVEKEALRLGMELSAYCTEAVEWCCSQPDIGARLAARLAAKRAAMPAPDTVPDIPTTFIGTGTHVQQLAPQPDSSQNKPSLS
ncbi:Hypothetical protein PYTT_2390 [Akkermansia glycaniphila]|uniref:Lambda repressor-like dna-binding domain n=2 Tax=Akkermansia glycaniphila TaxID=1679444 RepID=A0A1H6MJ56_9BACT|nr:Hypothetical protein PYTT_2390 [Akkermansia glycaniphila]